MDFYGEKTIDITAFMMKKKQKSNKLKMLEDYKEDRKADYESLYTKIDGILEMYGILRAAYHGGNLTGVCVINLMSYAEK